MPAGHSRPQQSLVTGHWVFEEKIKGHSNLIQDFAKFIGEPTPTTCQLCYSSSKRKDDIAVSMYDWLNWLKDNEANKIPSLNILTF